MSLPLTLALLLPSAGLLGFSIWRIRHPLEPGIPRLIDWHYVLFPTIILTGLLLLHLFMLLIGR